MATILVDYENVYELYELVEAIANFYRNSPIELIDKSMDLKNMELKVKNY